MDPGLAQLLGGGAPGATQGGDASGLAQLLGGAGSGGPDQSGPPGPDAGGGVMGPDEILQAMLQLASLYRSAESDQGDKLKMERASTLIQQILADRQSHHDQLIGGNYGALRRMAG